MLIKVNDLNGANVCYRFANGSNAQSGTNKHFWLSLEKIYNCVFKTWLTKKKSYVSYLLVFIPIKSNAIGWRTRLTKWSYVGWSAGELDDAEVSTSVWEADSIDSATGHFTYEKTGLPGKTGKSPKPGDFVNHNLFSKKQYKWCTMLVVWTQKTWNRVNRDSRVHREGAFLLKRKQNTHGTRAKGRWRICANLNAGRRSWRRPECV